MKMVKQNLMPRTVSGLIEDLLNTGIHSSFRDSAVHDDWIQHWGQTPVNIREQDTAYQIDVVAPGITKEDLKIQVNDNVLTIAFNQKEEQPEHSGQWLRKEFKVRDFKRSFTLGEKVDAEKISAKYENGILHLELPKKETALATNKVIEIQ